MKIRSNVYWMIVPVLLIALLIGIRHLSSRAEEDISSDTILYKLAGLKDPLESSRIIASTRKLTSDELSVIASRLDEKSDPGLCLGFMNYTIAIGIVNGYDNTMLRLSRHDDNDVRMTSVITLMVRRENEEVKSRFSEMRNDKDERVSSFARHAWKEVYGNVE